MTTDLDAMMEFADQLPSLPVAVVKALQLLRDDNSSNDDIAAALQLDQALVAQVLKLSNSPYYGVSRRVSTVQQAILVLGRKTVRSLVIAAAAQDFLSKPQAGYMLRRGELWSHSLAVASAAGLIARRVGYKPVDEAFVAGLLHDIGKVVMSGYLAEDTDVLLERLTTGADLSFDAIERELVEVDHATLGGLIAEHWQLPEHLGRAIACHHEPSTAAEHWRLATIVHVANSLALVVGIGVGVDGLQYRLDEVSIARLGLDAAALEELVGALIDDLESNQVA